MLITTTAEPVYVWTQRCRLTGETLQVELSASDKRAIEAQPTFRGWERDELQELQ